MSALRLSRPAAVIDQAVLWPWVGDRTLQGAPAARYYTGTFFEEATRVLTGAVRLETDGRADICPDLAHGDRDFLEVKASGGRELILFRHRLENERRLLDERFGASLTYVIWVHDAPVQSCTRLHELRATCAAHVRGVLVLPFERLYAAARRAPVVRLHYRAWDEAPVEAVRLPIGRLRELARGPLTLRRPVGRVHGHQIGSVEISGPDLGRLFPAITPAERQAAGELLAELSEHRLNVGLVQAPRPRFGGHMVRQVNSRNPGWYSALCEGFPAKRRQPRHRRRFDTDIRRRFVEKALDRLSTGVCRYAYDFHLRPFVEQAARLLETSP